MLAELLSVMYVDKQKTSGRQFSEMNYARRSRPPFPKGGRTRLINFPIEKIVIARPRVDFAPANLAAESARMLVRMLFPSCGVG